MLNYLKCKKRKIKATNRQTIIGPTTTKTASTYIIYTNKTTHASRRYYKAG